jgi:glycerophosphoryl diester phosphodiesterase
VKLLSHRARGFGFPDNSARAVVAAVEAGMEFVEIDTRVSKDGVVFAHHDPKVKTANGRVSISKLTAAEIEDRSSLETLRTVVEAFAEVAERGAKLCVDIKDYGFEAEHLEAIAGLAKTRNVVVGSWSPRSLLTVHRLNPDIPLILYFTPMIRLGWLGRGLSRLIRNREFGIGSLVFFGSEASKAEPKTKHRIGKQLAMITDRIPDEISSALLASGGGIVVSNYLLCSKLRVSLPGFDGLELWIFTANTELELDRCEALGVDVAFTDRPEFLERSS